MDTSVYTATLDMPGHALPCACSSCAWTGATNALVEIVDCALTPGDASPAGRCPECGSLAYLDRTEDRARDVAPYLLRVLRQIQEGSAENGRWLAVLEGRTAIDPPEGEVASPDAAPAGYYDEDEPDEGDEQEAPWPDDLAHVPEEDRAQYLCVQGRWLAPARWEAYSGEEQDQWLLEVADLAARAIRAAQLGHVPA